CTPYRITLSKRFCFFGCLGSSGVQLPSSSIIDNAPACLKLRSVLWGNGYFAAIDCAPKFSDWLSWHPRNLTVVDHIFKMQAFVSKLFMKASNSTVIIFRVFPESPF